ncbi:MAG: hypothetical protein L6365_14075, partial [Desulfobulbaceae bacterium]|nr:hypothetical protein [Desulfobulbaceae bacterium]
PFRRLPEPRFVIPAKAGIQVVTTILDPGLRRGDDEGSQVFLKLTALFSQYRTGRQRDKCVRKTQKTGRNRCGPRFLAGKSKINGPDRWFRVVKFGREYHLGGKKRQVLAETAD